MEVKFLCSVFLVINYLLFVSTLFLIGFTLLFTAHRRGAISAVSNIGEKVISDINHELLIISVVAGVGGILVMIASFLIWIFVDWYIKTVRGIGSATHSTKKKPL